MQKKPDPTRTILIAALISAAASFALYLPSLGFDFVNWDDYMYVYRNAALQSDNLDWAFTSVIASTWIPLTFLSYELDYSIWGLDPFGYHLTNTVLHAANSFLIALLAARLVGARGGLGARAVFIIALSAGLLFGLHPLRVESVAWVSERKDVLNALFFLLGLHAYLSYAASRKAASYMLTLVFFVLSLLSKPMTVTMPLVLLILDYYPLGRVGKDSWRRPLLEKLPFFCISIAAGLITVWSQESALVPQDLLPLGGRIHVAARAYVFYIYKTLLPANLAPLYPIDLSASIDLLFAMYLIALSAITALVFYFRKWSNTYISAWAYFVITLIPVVGLLQVGGQAAADRYTYLPGISLAMLAAAGAGWIVKRKRKAFPAVLAAVAVLSALLSFLTFRQAAVWKNSFALWDHQIGLYPDNPRGHIMRGTAYALKGNYDQAIIDLSKGIELDPFYDLEVYSTRGNAFVNAGRFEEGIADFTHALYLRDGDKTAYKARGTAYAVAGQYANALKDFLKAAKLDPSDASTHIELGKVYMHLGDNRNSYLSMKKALELGDPNASRYLEDLETWGAGHNE